MTLGINNIPGIIKYQNPAHGIIKQDNTSVAKPIEQTFIKRTYQPSQTYLSQDNRTQLQHEEGQKKANEAYKQQIKDKNVAEALNHLYGFGNFLDYISLGLGVGTLAKKGIRYGVKQAAEKLANQKIGIVAPQFQQKGKFVSELDWSPKSWFEDAGKWKDYTQADVDALNSHLQEYLDIERISKESNKWLKMPDGTTWTGDPRSWVQLVSKDGRKMSPNYGFHGIRSISIDGNPEFNQKIFLSKDKNVARSYTTSDDNIQTLTVPRNVTNYTADAEGRRFDKAWKIEQNGKSELLSTDAFAYNTIEHPNPVLRTQVATMKNVIDPGPNKPLPVLNTVSTDIIVGSGTPRKSLLGNNGNFNLLDKNIFRIGLPIILGTNYDNRRNQE